MRHLKKRDQAYPNYDGYRHDKKESGEKRLVTEYMAKVISQEKLRKWNSVLNILGMTNVYRRGW